MYVFYDPNQQIYGGGPAEDLGLKATKLKYNCRNTKNIAEFSCKLIDFEPVLKTGMPVGEGVVLSQSNKDSKDMVDAVRKFLHKLIHENGISTEQIVILTTRKIESSPISKVGKLGNISLVSLEQKPGPNEVRFSTLHRFKGLEADVVIVCDVQPGSEESSAQSPLCRNVSRTSFVGGLQIRGMSLRSAPVSCFLQATSNVFRLGRRALHSSVTPQVQYSF